MQVHRTPGSPTLDDGRQTDPDLYRSAWAGHVFDVVPRSREGEEERTDVTGKVVANALALCDSPGRRSFIEAERKVSEEPAAASNRPARLRKVYLRRGWSKECKNGRSKSDSMIYITT